MTHPAPEFVDQRALTLAMDVALLLEQSHQRQGESLGGAHARSAITSAALLLECVSNSCLFSLTLPARLLEELDKLSPIAKFDYYLFSRSGKHVDRGCRETELAADVLKLRDHIVHPKPKPGLIAGDGTHQYVDYGETKSLAIPLDSREWTHEDGRKVAEAATGFLSSFFLTWCGQHKGQVTCLLTAREPIVIRHAPPAWVYIAESELQLVKRWLPELLEFMDLRAPQADA